MRLPTRNPGRSEIRETGMLDPKIKRKRELADLFEKNEKKE